MSETPPTPCRRVWSRRLDRAFRRRLPERHLRALRDHASSCDHCRAVYDHLAQAERALCAEPFPAPAVRRVQVLALGRGRRFRPLWAPAGALAAAAAAIVIWIIATPPGAPRDEFRARGGPSELEALAPGEREPGVRLFCVDVSDRGAHVTDEVHMTAGSMPSSTLSCTIEDELQIAYSTPNLPGLTMMVFAHSPSGSTQWYAPPDPGASSVPLAADVIDEPLAWSTRLGARHEAGHYEVVARFFLGPVPASPGAEHAALELRARLDLDANDLEVP